MRFGGIIPLTREFESALVGDDSRYSYILYAERHLILGQWYFGDTPRSDPMRVGQCDWPYLRLAADKGALKAFLSRKGGLEIRRIHRGISWSEAVAWVRAKQENDDDSGYLGDYDDAADPDADGA